MSEFLNNILGRTRSGETIIEILISLFVLVTTSSAATYVIAQTNRTNYDIKQNFQARYLAREAFEELKMIRDTNWIRFSDKNCWDVKLETKDCVSTAPDHIISGTSPTNFALVMSKPSNFSMHLSQVATSNSDPFDDCMKLNSLNTNAYSIFRETSSDPKNNPYEGILYSTDGTPPANASPIYCRKITLTNVHADAIKADVSIGWKVGSENKITTYTSYFINYSS